MKRSTALWLIPMFLAVPHPSSAGPPAPCNCSFPCAIVLVGTNPIGAADPAGLFTIVTRHIGNDPWSEGPVMLDFSGCPDVSICSVQVSQGVTITCLPGTRTISAIPDRSGVITLTLVGGVAHRSSPASTGCLEIYADAIRLTDGGCHPPVTVSALDESGGDGLSAADLGLWLSDYFSSTYQPRSDFDHALTCIDQVDPGDLSRWMSSYFGGYVLGCSSLSGTLCP